MKKTLLLVTMLVLALLIGCTQAPAKAPTENMQQADATGTASDTQEQVITQENTQNADSEELMQDNEMMGEQEMADTTMDEMMDTMHSPQKVTIDVEMFQYGFEPDPIVVKKGQEVTLRLTSRDVAHGIAIPEFDVFSDRVSPGEEATVTFVADKAGTYYFNCNTYCGSGHGGMIGKLVVEE